MTAPTPESYPSAYTLANNAQQADIAVGPALSIIENSGPGGLTNISPNNQINGQSAYEQAFYNNDILPNIAQTQQAVYNNGMQNSSAGGAEIGTELAQGAAQEGLAGQQYYTNALNNFLNTRNSFFGGEGALATNSAAGQLQAAQNTNQNTLNYDQLLGGLNQTLAGLQTQNTANENQFNLANAGLANNYNSSIYGTGANIYGTAQGGLNSQYATQGNIYGNQLQAKGGL